MKRLKALSSNLLLRKVRHVKDMIFPVPPLLKLSHEAGRDQPPDTVPYYHTLQRLLWISFVEWTHSALVVSSTRAAL